MPETLTPETPRLSAIQALILSRRGCVEPRAIRQAASQLGLRYLTSALPHTERVQRAVQICLNVANSARVRDQLQQQGIFHGLRRYYRYDEWGRIIPNDPTLHL